VSDIFQEVDNELRRDRLSRFWNENGIIIISAAIAIVVAVTVSVIYKGIQNSRNEAAFERYTAMLDTAAAAEDVAQVLRQFVDQEDNGYGVLAQFRLAKTLADDEKFADAAALYEQIATRGDLPVTVRDFANLMAGASLVGQASAADIQARLGKMLDAPNGFRGQAREVYALALLLEDDPLAARDLLQAHIAETAMTPAMRLRAQILLDEALQKLRLSGE
jgi:hypothetical protein